MSVNYGAPSRHSSHASYSSRYGATPRPASSAQYGAQQGYYGGGAPGYGSAPPAHGPPPGADPQLWQWFSAVDTDRSGAISVTELQAALVNGNWTRFDLDTVKMLMSIFDTDRSGTIGFNEFAGLWKYIQDWQNVFRHFDRDRSGSIDGAELSEALRSFGYNLSPILLSLLEQKYVASGPSDRYGPPPGITFDRFVRACVVVKTLTEAFQRVDTDRDGWVQMNYEQFMKIVLSAP
ncbi:EF-hand [Lentinus tigrinus ALCF2SS1-7]|uniref:EF-hand n=1 Tax=Lentinus tigrinus ALCF2SS1-6 TaxID=1328759 RepID=A0A5C2SQT3_9APHY|nr:EF-hand [Lentinus tigrinus ALCF2SS1-6]RPD79958.1 EF-hand [Lentinus tigrinus ALCF2SS1-7]